MDEVYSSRHARVSSLPRRLPSFAALAAFEAVARHASFAKAAGELSITQSAVSHRIKALERQFNARFFVRSSRVVALTDEGRLFLDAVRDAFSTLESACERLGRPQKVVRLSVGPAFARAWLVAPLGEFYRSHADVDVEVNATKLASGEKLACLRSGEADVSIRYGSAGDWPGFECVRLTRTDLFPVCSPGYKAELGNCSHPCALLRATLLRSPREPWAPWFAAMRLECAEPQHGPQFSDAALTLDAAARGQGVALARSTLVEPDLQSGRLVQLCDARLPSTHAYHAIYTQAAAHRPEVDAFLSWLTARARAAGEGAAA
jgi:LysR family glycine cleavage system transcriptional activator